MRAVLAVNVLVSGLLAPEGAPAEPMRRWLAGEFELVVSEKLLAELRRAPVYPKLRGRVPEAVAPELVSLIRANATIRPDTPHPPRRSRDPGDDYVIALAESSASILVTGDQDVLDLSGPILSPARFAAGLEA